jgi:uncharacterized protein YerC
MSTVALARWRELAACADKTHRHLFAVKYPTEAAREVCKGCPVRAECLHDALVSNATGGLWGGMTRKERRALPTLPAGQAPAVAFLRELLGPAVTAKPAALAGAPRRTPARATTPRKETRSRSKTKPKAKRRTVSASPREDVAELLRAGATQRQIMAELNVPSMVVVVTRKTYGIPYHKGGSGFRYTPQQRAENERRILELLRAGVTYAKITAETGVKGPTITEIRKRAGLPAAKGRNGSRARSKAEVLAAYVEPYGDGHARWTGPRTGRTPQLCAEGGQFNARHVTFEAHHGRPRVGYVRTSCNESDCIAGAHLTDDTMRRLPIEGPRSTAVQRKGDAAP